MSFMSRTRIDERNAKAHLAESYNELYQKFSTHSPVQEVGNYEILKPIGEGSFGKVFLAYHKLFHTKVVLKQGRKDDPNVVREVYYQREFKHPSITKLYEVIVTDLYIYMVLEYCPDGELYDHLISSRRIPVPKIKKLFSQICGSVYYIHQMNSCHRDLKLENILLDKKKHVKLADFGFTRELPGKKESCQVLPQQNGMLETICGTTVYMAPEMIEGKSYSGVQIDIWSLGVILYTITYGGMPFDEDDDLKNKYKILNTEPVYNDDVPYELIDLTKLMLSKDVSQRPQSLYQVLQHPFLQPYGARQMELVDVLLTKQVKPFQTKLEKSLLKKMGRLHFDTKQLVESVVEKRCDCYCAMWELMLEKERKMEAHKKKKLSRSRSVLRLSQAIASSSPRGHGRKGSYGSHALSAILSNQKESPPGAAREKNNNNNTGFDSYSQTLNDDSLVSPSKSTHSTTRVNTTASSQSPVAADLQKRRSVSVQSIDSSKKYNTIFKKIGKLWKNNRKHDDPDQIAPVETETIQRQPTRQEAQQVPGPADDVAVQFSGDQTPNGVTGLGSTSPRMMSAAQAMKRSASSNSMKLIRPASMISTYSSYSQLTTMSETSIGSDNNTSYSADNTTISAGQVPQSLSGHRPQYHRAKSSEVSVYSRYSGGRGNDLSSNSSATNISRSTSIDSSKSGSVKNRGRNRHQKRNANFFVKRGKSPIGYPNRFSLNKKKMGLLNANSKKSKSSVIQEEYESSLSNSTSNMSIKDTDAVAEGAAADVEVEDGGSEGLQAELLRNGVQDGR